VAGKRLKPRTLRVLSWNVNGLRAIAEKGFREWLAGCEADIVGVQEVRARPEQLPVDLRESGDWHSHWVAAERAGYSGVGLLARRAPDKLDPSLGIRRFDAEGRLLTARFKLGFYRAVFERIERLRRAGFRVLVMGDFNTAHAEIDLARPRENKTTSGFLPEERAELDRWLRAGWIDTFRRFQPEPGHYSWWSQRGTARQRNIGWRIDYVLASPNLAPLLRGAFIQPNVVGSDHAPIGVDLDPLAFD
jgi:exodeoxyribonuclease-3